MQLLFLLLFTFGWLLLHCSLISARSASSLFPHVKVYCVLCPFVLAPAVEPAVTYPTTAYPAHTYSPDPTPASSQHQEEMVIQNNGRLTTEEHSVLNMITATTNDSITMSSSNVPFISCCMRCDCDVFWIGLNYKQIRFSSYWNPSCFNIIRIFVPFCLIYVYLASSPRKIYDTRDSGSSVTQIDFDDDKYRRCPALSWFAQILK